MDVNPLSVELLVGLAFGIGVLLGALLLYGFSRSSKQQLNQEIQKLTLMLDSEQRLAAQREQAYAQIQKTLSEHFSALSADALRKNNESFLKLAEENLKGQQLKAQADLEKREQSIDALVKPIKDALLKTEKQIQDIEKDRQLAYGSLTQHLQTMAETQSQLQAETRNLVKALRRPEVRGQWGELTLHRLVEIAGMVQHCDFFEQTGNEQENNRLRPDMLVRMPENRVIVVDAKTPLDAYLNAMEAQTDAEKQQQLEQHARNIHKRIRELSAKEYWAQFERSPEFVVLFIPGEQFLASALDINPELTETAMNQRVILATPNNFIALLKTISFGWRQMTVAENAEKIRKLGEELHQRLSTFFNHISGIGDALGKGVDKYNQALGSLERMVIPSARKFSELGIQSSKTLDIPETIEKNLRPVNPKLGTD